MWAAGQRISILTVFVALTLIGAAEAQEYCVACTEPGATYRCIIEGAQPGGGSLQMLCVTTLARDGNHATCSVKGGTVFDCNGPVKRIPWTATDAQPVGPGKAAAEPPPKAKPKADDPPQTVVEMAKRANEKTAEQMKKANDNMKDAAKSVGDATKKTWECMISLFTRC
jgi:hypothetical protein